MPYTPPSKGELQALQSDRALEVADFRARVYPDKLEFRYHGGMVPGTHVIEAYQQDHPAPVGAVWWRWGMGDDEVEVVNSYVMADMRRLGIRTALHHEMIRWLKPKRVITGGTSTVEGVAWMQHAGYRLDRKRNVWYYTVKKGKQHA